MMKMLQMIYLICDIVEQIIDHILVFDPDKTDVYKNVISEVDIQTCTEKRKYFNSDLIQSCQSMPVVVTTDPSLAAMLLGTGYPGHTTSNAMVVSTQSTSSEARNMSPLLLSSQPEDPICSRGI